MSVLVRSQMRGRQARIKGPRPVAKAVDPLNVLPPRYEREAIQAVRAMLESVVDQVPAATIERAITHPQVLDSLDLGLDTDALTAALLGTVREAGTREARSIRVVKAEPALRASFNLNDPRAEAWARSSSARLVVEVTASTRDSIRNLITRAIVEGGHPSVVARQIKPLIGLHSRWSNAVLNYRYGLEAGGLPVSSVESLTAKYYDRLLTTRSRTIARTEILSASNQGKYLGMVQAQSQGLLSGTATKVWIAAGDAEAVCADLDGTEVGLQEDFSSELGDVAHPPLHPNCRCTIAIGKGS